MADCAGDWTHSKIKWKKKNGVIHPIPLELPDGEFTINAHVGTTFGGTHHDPQGNTTHFTQTSCTDSTTPNKFNIKMRRPDLTVNPPETYEYTGEGTITNPVTGEAKIKGNVVVHGPPTGDDTGTWETSRPGGGSDDDEDEKVKKNKIKHKGNHD